MTCPTSSTLTQGLNNEYCVSLKTGYGKKENKTSDLANSNSKEAATAGLATTASPLITKSTDVPDPLIHKFQVSNFATSFFSLFMWCRCASLIYVCYEFFILSTA